VAFAGRPPRALSAYNARSLLRPPCGFLVNALKNRSIVGFIIAPAAASVKPFPFFRYRGGKTRF
jgi:hypothetical protein